MLDFVCTFIWVVGCRKQSDGICMIVSLFPHAQTFCMCQVHAELHKSACHNACTEQLIKMV